MARSRSLLAAALLLGSLVLLAPPPTRGAGLEETRGEGARAKGGVTEELDPWRTGDEEAAYRGRIDVVFCLDATGSMGGEIAAAKSKIRDIAHRIRAGEGETEHPPVVRFGVVVYRDRTDSEPERVLDLTEDVDRTYSFLAGIEAQGGGDGPENVRRALQAAVHEMSWSDDPEAVKMIFLVGDAPPHTDYADLPPCLASAREGLKRNITLSTIACGELAGYPDGLALWKQLAAETYGSFEELPRSGGLVARPGAAAGGFALRGRVAPSAAMTAGLAMAPDARAVESGAGEVGSGSDAGSADRLSDFVVESVMETLRRRRR